MYLRYPLFGSSAFQARCRETDYAERDDLVMDWARYVPAWNGNGAESYSK